MSEPVHRPGALDDDATHPSDPVDASPKPNDLSPSLDLLQQSIDQLEGLRAEYNQLYCLLTTLSHQILDRETQVSQQIRDVTALLAHSHAAPRPGARGNGAVDEEETITLRVQTLGSFRIRCGDRSLPLGSSKKGRAVLRYLVTHPRRRATRDTLLELFWPQEDPDRARHKLHIAISTVRQALAEALGERPSPEMDLLCFEEEQYSLHPAVRVELDSDRFATHYRAGERLERKGRLPEAAAEYEAARALYRGDWLPQDLYADWTLAPRARLEEMYLTLLGRLAAHYLEGGRCQESIACGRQILERDTFREDAYRLLMRAYSRLGQRSQALREFAICAETLQRELGVSPMRETVELYERIQRQEDC